MNSKAMMGELKSLAMISGGMVLGSMGGQALDKALGVDPTLPGMNAKKYVRPAALLGAGIVGSMKLKNPDMKLVAAGVGASGVVSTVKVLLKKDLLAGLTGTAGVSGLGSSWGVYRDPVRVAIDRYEPELPELDGMGGGAALSAPVSMGASEDADYEII
jgi:hypothetical protein